jgi:hypothetical protein
MLAGAPDHLYHQGLAGWVFLEQQPSEDEFQFIDKGTKAWWSEATCQEYLPVLPETGPKLDLIIPTLILPSSKACWGL